MSNMKSNENPHLKTQIKGIKVLLDGSKKTQNQIAKETNSSKSSISHAFNGLEKRNIIKRETIKKYSGYTNKGNYTNKNCWLTYDVDNGSEVMRFFQEVLKLKKLKTQEATDIIENLQKYEKSIYMILKKHPESCYPDLSKPACVGIYKDYDPTTNVEVRIEQERDEFISQLQSSQKFFKIFLMNDSETIKKKFNESYWFSINDYIKGHTNAAFEKGEFDQVHPLILRNVCYKDCVKIESLDGTDEATADKITLLQSNSSSPSIDLKAALDKLHVKYQREVERAIEMEKLLSPEEKADIEVQIQEMIERLKKLGRK